jgi:hypothetical protein
MTKTCKTCDTLISIFIFILVTLAVLGAGWIIFAPNACDREKLAKPTPQFCMKCDSNSKEDVCKIVPRAFLYGQGAEVCWTMK